MYLRHRKHERDDEIYNNDLSEARVTEDYHSLACHDPKFTKRRFSFISFSYSLDRVS